MKIALISAYNTVLIIIVGILTFFVIGLQKEVDSQKLTIERQNTLIEYQNGKIENQNVVIRSVVNDLIVRLKP